MDKENNNKKRKAVDWECTYCKILYLDDENNGRNVTWINCDTCDRKMHIKCVCKPYLNKINYTGSDDECDFICEACYQSDK